MPYPKDPSDQNDPDYNPIYDPKSPKYDAVQARNAQFADALGRITGGSSKPAAPDQPLAPGETKKTVASEASTYGGGNTPGPVNPNDPGASQIASSSRPLALPEILAAYHANTYGQDDSSNRKGALDALTNSSGGLQYSVADANRILNTSDTAKDKSVSIANLTKAYAEGHLDDNALKQQLIKAGLSSDDANVSLDLAKDAKGQTERTKAKQAWSDAKDQKAMQKTDEKDAWDAQHGTDAMGNGSQFDANLGTGGALKAYKMGLIDRNAARTRLIKEGGLNNNDAELEMQMADTENAPQGGGDNSPRPMGGGSYARPAASKASSFSGGGGMVAHVPTQKPRAEGILNDFRTAFAQNLQTNAPGLSTPAKQWAMDNQDIFLNRYLGQVGVGGVNGGASFTMGANEIQNLYEGSKGSRRASQYAGGGEQASIV